MKPPPDPTRLLDPSSGVPEELRRLLAEGHKALSPTHAQLHQLTEHVAPLIGGSSGGGGGGQGGAPTTPTTPTAPPPVPTAPLTNGIAKVLTKSVAAKVVAILLVGGAVAGGSQWQRHANKQVDVSLRSPLPAAAEGASVPASMARTPLSLSASAALIEPITPAVPALPPASVSVSSHAAEALDPGLGPRPSVLIMPRSPSLGAREGGGTPATTGGGIPESPTSLGARGAAAAPVEPAKTELELLAEARKLERDPARALDILADHRRRFPNGTFEQEREVLVIESLVRLHRTDEAVARGGAFAKRFPNSVHLRRIRVVLGQSPDP